MRIRIDSTIFTLFTFSLSSIGNCSEVKEKSLFSCVYRGQEPCHLVIIKYLMILQDFEMKVTSKVKLTI